METKLVVCRPSILRKAYDKQRLQGLRDSNARDLGRFGKVDPSARDVKQQRWSSRSLSGALLFSAVMAETHEGRLTTVPASGDQDSMRAGDSPYPRALGGSEGHARAVTLVSTLGLICPVSWPRAPMCCHVSSPSRRGSDRDFLHIVLGTWR